MSDCDSWEFIKERLYIFFREGGFYPLELLGSEVARNAEYNPGTLRVEDSVTGEIVWEKV